MILSWAELSFFECALFRELTCKFGGFIFLGFWWICAVGLGELDGIAGLNNVQEDNCRQTFPRDGENVSRGHLDVAGCPVRALRAWEEGTTKSGFLRSHGLCQKP